MKRLIMMIMAVALLLPGVSQATTMSGADYTSSAGRIISGGSSATDLSGMSKAGIAIGLGVFIRPSGSSSSPFTIKPYIPGSAAGKITPTITWGNPSDITYGTALSGSQLNASSGVSGTFTYNPAAGTLLNAGNSQTLNLTFTPTDTASYNDAAADVSINVTRADQSITFNSTPNVGVGGAGTLSATATSALSVAFASSTPAVCTVSGSTVTGVAIGTCSITANQSGNSNYNAAAQVSTSFNTKTAQSISFAALSTTPLGSAPFTLSATASSALAVTFASSDSSVASLSGTTLTLRKAGTTYITASQSGNANWLAAPTVTRTLTVTSFGKPSLTVSTLSNGSVTKVNTLNISGTADSVNGGTVVTINGAAVILESDNSFSSPYPLVPGSNNITTVATDSASQSSSDSRTITLNLTAPELAVTAPVDNSSSATSLLTVTGSVTDANATVKVLLNNGTAQVASRNGNSFSSDLNLREGQNTIQVTATDLSQATSSLARTVTFNQQGPSLAITSPLSDLTTDQATITLTGTIADALSAVTVTITCDGHNYTKTVTAPGGSFSQALAAFATAGSYSITVTAVDTNGNQSVSRRNVIYQPAPLVTVTSTPVGRTVVVDGVAVVTPQIYSWSTGSSHTIAVLTTTQNGSSGTRYQFGSWSDAGAVSHSITVPATSATYTASFATQHQLSTSAGVGGTVQPATGNWYSAGTNATIIATPTTGYAFNNWGLTGTGPILSATGSATSITMNGPNSVVANFKSNSTTLTASLNSAGKSGTLGGIRSWPIILTNTGGVAATSAQINSMAVSSSSTCKPVVTTPFPLSVGSINPGNSTTVYVTVNFSTCSAVKQIALKFNASINYSANGGGTAGVTNLTGVTQ